jgi:hypothetical protein
VTCRLDGACRGCPAAPVTVVAVIERALQTHVEPTLTVKAPQLAVSSHAVERIRRLFPRRGEASLRAAKPPVSHTTRGVHLWSLTRSGPAGARGESSSLGWRRWYRSSPSSAGSSAVAQEAPEALVAAAKKEGEVVVYSAESDKQVADTSKAFEAKYGIKVQGVRLVSGTLTSRYAGERQGNNVVADVVVISNDPFVTDNPSWWVPLSESVLPGYEKFPAAAKGPLFVTMNHNVIGIAWNTNLVKPADEPKSYLDVVTNPAFAAKAASCTPIRGRRRRR